MELSEHFTWSEAHTTSTGIPNNPPENVIPAIQYTASKMEIVREMLGGLPIHINSWYRSPEVNKVVGGVPDSQHLTGEAVDFICPSFGTPKDICLFIVQHSTELKSDQLIYENTWVHISFKAAGNNRGDILTLSRGIYINGIR